MISTLRRARAAAAVAAVFHIAACNQGTSPPVDYRPEETGSVDQAMCLLGFTALPLMETATGHHLVDAEINGQEGRFVLDTGANVTVIDRSQMPHFNLSVVLPGIGGAIGVGGGGSAAQVAIDGFSIGDVPIRQRRVVTSDLGPLLVQMSRLSGGRVHGIIGQDVLNEHRAIIDVARPMLYLMEADRAPSPVPAERCSAPAGRSGS